MENKFIISILLSDTSSLGQVLRWEFGSSQPNWEQMPGEDQSEPHLSSDVVLGQLVTERLA